MYKTGTCCICERAEQPLTKHHLIPKTCHSTKWFVKNFSSEEMAQGIMLCRLCHNFIHQQWDEKDLGRNYNTLEKLLATEKVQKFLPFAKKQK